MKISVCIPTYNESENIINLLKTIESECKDYLDILEIVVIDDNSPDGTAKLVEDFKSSNTKLNVRIINNPNKGGLGKAYIVGFKSCLENGTDKVIMMDSDFSHDPMYLKEFIEKSKSFDFIIGTRYANGGGTVNWSFVRRMISKFGNLYSQIILGVNITDLTGGFNLYSKEILNSINLDEIKSNGYSFQIEVKYKVFKKGFKFTEIPIIFKDREHGTSKFDSKIFGEAIFTPWKLKLGSSF